MLTANHHIHGCEERMGVQRGSKVASTVAAVKGTSRNETTLISEEIKSVALAVFELCLSEGISKSVSHLVGR